MSFDGDAFHLDKPSRSADGCEEEDHGGVGEVFMAKFGDNVVVGEVAEIDDELCDV